MNHDYRDDLHLNLDGTAADLARSNGTAPFVDRAVCPHPHHYLEIFPDEDGGIVVDCMLCGSPLN